MPVGHIEVFVEEFSMEVVLQALLDKLLTTTTFAIHNYNGKDRLLRRLGGRLRGYRNWLQQDWLIVVIVDRDDDDCLVLKRTLENICRDADFGTCTTPRRGKIEVVNRIVIEELEAWYFGDWTAVKAAYPRAPALAPHRHSDSIGGGTWEAFQRVMQRSGYFPGGLLKVEAARKIAFNMDIARNTSPSFRALFDRL